MVAEKIEQQLHIEANDVFDVDKLKMGLEDYIVKNKPENIISIALKSHQPLIKDSHITIQVDNQLQLDKLNAIVTSLQNHLIKSLNNGSIVLNFQLFDEKEGSEQKVLITSQDKLEHFIKLNPVVEQMKKMFGMEFE